MDRLFENRILWKKIGIILGVYLVMKYLVPLVVPFLAAGILVFWCRPFLLWVQKRLHLWPALVMGGLLLLAGLLLAGGIWLAWQKLFAEGIGQMEEWLTLRRDGIQIFAAEEMQIFLDGAGEKLFPEAAAETWKLVKGAGSFLAGGLMTGIAVLLLAADYEELRELGSHFPFYEKTAATVKGVLGSIGTYLGAQCIIMGSVMGICTVGLWWSGQTQSPLALGILIGLLDALPVLGTGTVLLPWVILCIFREQYGAAVILAASYGLSFLTRELLEPKLIGRRLGILPVFILAGVYGGVKLYGAGGILLGPLSLLLIRELWQKV